MMRCVANYIETDQYIVQVTGNWEDLKKYTNTLTEVQDLCKINYTQEAKQARYQQYKYRRKNASGRPFKNRRISTTYYDY